MGEPLRKQRNTIRCCAVLVGLGCTSAIGPFRTCVLAVHAEMIVLHEALPPAAGTARLLMARSLRSLTTALHEQRLIDGFVAHPHQGIAWKPRLPSAVRFPAATKPCSHSMAFPASRLHTPTPTVEAQWNC